MPKPGDVDALPDIEIMIRERRVDRWAAYKETRALSATTKRLTGNKLTEFKLPPGFIVRPIQQNEIRVVAETNIAYIVELDEAGREVGRWQEMPSEFDARGIPLLVIYLDQGSTLRAGLMFCVSDAKMLIEPRWDAFHRSPNDLKLAENHAAKGIFRRVQLGLQFVFSINYASFGKGDKYYEKLGMLDDFFATCISTAQVFRKYASRYAAANNMRIPITDDDFEEVFDSMMNMPSFNAKGPQTKASKWYQWWTQYDFQFCDLWGLKMIIEATGQHLQNNDEEIQLLQPAAIADPVRELRLLRQSTGNFRLAWKLITPDMVLYGNVLYRLGQPCWSAHTKRATTVKHPKHAVKWFAQLARGAWKDEIKAVHFAGFKSANNHAEFGLDCGVDTPELQRLSSAVGALCLHIIARRGQSQAMYSDLPPVCYAPLLEGSPMEREETSRLLATDLRNWLWLERVASRGFGGSAEVVVCMYDVSGP